MINPPDSVISSFTFSPLLGYVGEPILFTDLSGNTAVNDPCTYEWEWGDGAAWGTTKNASHTYSRAGNYTVVHWVTGSSSRNPTRDSKTLTVTVGVRENKIPCDSRLGNTTGIANMENYSGIWNSEGGCILPYICKCASPDYPKYKCVPDTKTVMGDGSIYTGGRGYELIYPYPHNDCCAFCGVASGTGDIPIQVPIATFEIESVTIDPTECNVGEFVTAVANVRNNGTAAGAATVVFFWSDGTSFGDLPRTTPIIGVNTTAPTPPAVGKAPSVGVLKLCAVFR